MNQSCIWKRVHWITNNNRVCRDWHIVVNWYLVSESLPSIRAADRGEGTVVLIWWNLLTGQNFSQEAQGTHSQTKMSCCEMHCSLPLTPLHLLQGKGMLYCKVWSTRTEQHPLLWACDRAELHSDRERTSRGAKKWWQKNLPCQNPSAVLWRLVCSDRSKLLVGRTWRKVRSLPFPDVQTAWEIDAVYESTCHTFKFSVMIWQEEKPQQWWWVENCTHTSEWHCHGDWLALERCFLTTVR